VNGTRVNYIIACHDRNKGAIGYDNEPNIGFIVPEKATPLVPRRGAYPQCRSLAAWLNKGHTMTPANFAGGSWFFTMTTNNTFFSSLEMLEYLNGTEWTTVQCANVWHFFGLIGYNYKNKRYEYPLDSITLLE
jgi:hypothetical protein